MFFPDFNPMDSMPDGYSPWAWQNNAFQNTPPAYGYQTGNRQPQFLKAPISIEEKQTLFLYDRSRNLYLKQKISSKGKVTITPLTFGYTINQKTLFYDETQNLVAVEITYQIENQVFRKLLTGEDYLSLKYDRYLTEVTRLPGCTRSLFNELAAFLVQMAPMFSYHLYPSQGWHLREGMGLAFASNRANFPTQKELMPSSVLRRKHPKYLPSPEEILHRWWQFCALDPRYTLFSYWRLGSHLIPFFEQAGLIEQQVLYIRPSDSFDEAKATAALATNDLPGNVPPNLAGNGDAVSRELRETRHGVAVFCDHAFADEDNGRINSLKQIVSSVRRDDICNVNSSLVAIISENAVLLGNKLAAENTIFIDTEGMICNESADQIREIVEPMDVLFQTAIQNNFTSFDVPLIHGAWARFRETNIGDVNEKLLGTFGMLYIVDQLIQYMFQVPSLHENTLPSIVDMLKKDCIRDTNTAIIHDFSDRLSTYFRTSRLQPVRKGRGICTQFDAWTAFIEGERVLISGEVLTSALSEMKTTNRQKTVIQALRQANALISTDGDTHRIEVKNGAGKNQTLHWYDIDMNLLDADVISMLKNLDLAEFWLDESEIPAKNFIPLLRNGCGKVAGILEKPELHENHSTFHCGISGSGKTTALTAQSKSYYDAGDTVIWLDANNSVTTDVLKDNLSAAWVDANVIIHDLDRKGLPIDTFKFEREQFSKANLKAALHGLFCAGIKKLTEMQSDTLKNAVSDLLKVLDPREPIRPEDLLTILDEEDASYKTLRKRLSSFIDDLDDWNMATATWDDYLKESGRFIVFRTAPTSSEDGCPIFDVLMISLLIYKMTHPEKMIHLFMDEVQSQSLAAYKPIQRILREGRKYNLALHIATQECPARSTELGKAKGNTAAQIYLRPTDNSELVVASELRWGKADIAAFDSMEFCDAIIKGNFYSKKQHRNIPATLQGEINRRSTTEKGHDEIHLSDDNAERGENND